MVPEELNALCYENSNADVKAHGTYSKQCALKVWMYGGELCSCLFGHTWTHYFALLKQMHGSIWKEVHGKAQKLITGDIRN